MPVVMLEMSRYAQNTNFTLVVKLEKSRCARCAPNFTQVVKWGIRSSYAVNPGATFLKGIQKQQLAPTELAGFGA